MVDLSTLTLNIHVEDMPDQEGYKHGQESTVKLRNIACLIGAFPSLALIIPVASKVIQPQPLLQEYSKALGTAW